MSSYRPHRWSDLPPNSADPEGEVGRLLREAKTLEGPSRIDLARIRERVEARVEHRGQRRFLGQRLSAKGLVTGLLGAAALASVGAVVGVASGRLSRETPPPVVSFRRGPVPMPAPVMTPEEIVRENQAAAPTIAVDAAHAGEVAAGLEPELGPPPPSLRRRHHTRSGSRNRNEIRMLGPSAGGETAPASSAPAGLAAESALLGQALREQRNEQPAAALATLQEYERLYPHGALADEAMAAQLQVMLTLGRHRDALKLLDRLLGDRMPPARRTELLTLRGELLAQSGRCEEAIPLLDRLLDQTLTAALQERALFRRAECRAQRGDDQSARTDLERYLAVFPSGRFAEQARKLLRK